MSATKLNSMPVPFLPEQLHNEEIHLNVIVLQDDVLLDLFFTKSQYQAPCPHDP